MRVLLVLLLIGASVSASTIEKRQQQQPAASNQPGMDVVNQLIGSFQGLGAGASGDQSSGPDKAMDFMKTLFGRTGGQSPDLVNQNGAPSATPSGSNPGSGSQAIDVMRQLFGSLAGGNNPATGQSTFNPQQSPINSGSGYGNNPNPIDMFKGLFSG